MKACRPLLGTYVEIRVDHPDADLAPAAVDAGFAAISRVQRLMSVFDPDSDISRINRMAHHKPVVVHSWTREILEFAGELHARSGGLFDCGIAPQLVACGLLPPDDAPAGASSIANVHFTRAGRVICTTPTRLDLGGIAKGFAVDRAAEAMLSAGAEGGMVNAGGDLRVFGSSEEAIYLRDPANPEQLRFAGHLRDGACATSATYYSRRDHGGREVSALIDPRTRQPLITRQSFSIIAQRCVVADALTKVLAIAADPTLPCFSSYNAHPLILDQS